MDNILYTMQKLKYVNKVMCTWWSDGIQLCEYPFAKGFLSLCDSNTFFISDETY